MISRIGEFAAFGTSVSWTIGALIMERSVKRVGVMAVNTLKVAFGSVYLALFAFFLTGQLFPLHAPASAWIFLGASALFGFVIGDYFLFHAYDLIGSRLAMLLMSISVPLTAIGARLVFGERLGLSSILGIAVCVSGIALTVVSGKPGAPPPDSGNDSGEAVSGAASASKHSHAARYAKGVAYGLLSGLFMAVATLMTKRGAADIAPVAATQIRIFCAFVGFVAFALVTGKIGEVGRALRNPAGVGSVAAGGIFGPFIGVGLLLFALQNANAGIVSTLSSFSPVLIIFPSVILFKRRVSPGEMLGAVIAVAGLAVLFL